MAAANSVDRIRLMTWGSHFRPWHDGFGQTGEYLLLRGDGA